MLKLDVGDDDRDGWLRLVGRYVLVLTDLVVRVGAAGRLVAHRDHVPVAVVVYRSHDSS